MAPTLRMWTQRLAHRELWRGEGHECLKQLSQLSYQFQWHVAIMIVIRGHENCRKQLLQLHSKKSLEA